MMGCVCVSVYNHMCVCERERVCLSVDEYGYVGT